MKRTKRRTGTLLAALFISVSGLVATLFSAPLHAAADCNGGNPDPITGGGYTYGYGSNEWVTYKWDDGETGKQGSASTGTSWSFKQDYYENPGWYARNWCDWGNGWNYPSIYATQSMVDVEDGMAKPGGIPFTINNVKNGTDSYDYYHQRRSKYHQRAHFADDGWWNSMVVNTDRDSWASGRWNRGPEQGYWDPVLWSSVFTTSSDAKGGRLGQGPGVYIDYGF
jgi:hypothetical protein